MSTPLSRFQDGFASALYACESESDSAPAIPPDVAALVRQSGFAVYRNTAMKGCIDALQANYPSVTRLVGEEWFRAAAALYVRAHRPVQPALLYYGEGYAAFLDQFEPASDLPYLSGVARLDRYWTEAHAASDELLLEPAAIAALAPEALAVTVLHPHAAARWAWFADQPIYTIWRRNREAQDDGAEIEWRGEGVLISRAHQAVDWIALDAAGCAFLDVCGEGRCMAEAAGAALEVQHDADLAQLMYTLMRAGAFAGMSRPGNEPHTEGHP